VKNEVATAERDLRPRWFQYLYVVGSIHYRDVFGAKRTTVFVYQHGATRVANGDLVLVAASVT